MKKTVNEAIKRSSCYDDFEKYIENNKLHICEVYPEEQAEDANDDPIIICKKSDYDDYTRKRNKVLFNTKRVNLEKKWEPQYSYREMQKLFGSRELDKRYDEKFISASVFIPSEKASVIVSERQVAMVTDILDLYIQYNEGGKAQFNAVKPKKDGNLYPVFYDDEARTGAVGGLRLAPAQISRSIYSNTVDILLGKKNGNPGHSPCTDIRQLCPACSLFGTVLTNSGNQTTSQNIAKCSRLRFSDAVGNGVSLFPAKMDGNTRTEDVPTLRELSSPKLTSMEFYSVRNSLTGYTDQPKWGYDSSGVTLRGRKMYFHNPKAELKPDDDPRKAVFCTKDKENKRNASMQLATKGRFDFSVYFDGITASELKTLVWALTLGETDGEGTHYHKLGHGRPLGLGSVKLTVNEIEERTCDGTSYGITSEKVERGYFDGFTLPIAGTDTFTALMTMTDFNYAAGLDEESSVAYPIGTVGGNPKTDNNTLQWFGLSHGALNSRGGVFKHVLHPLVVNHEEVPAGELLLPHLYPPGGQPHAADRSGGNRGNNGNTRGNAPKQLALNEEVDAKITHYKTFDNGKPMFIYFKVYGKSSRIHIKYFSKEVKNNPDGAIGKMIKVRYRGKDEKEYEKYVLVSE